MTGSITQPSVWEFARRQHGVITRQQLFACGLTRHGVQHRLAKGRLHLLWPRVYAVGRPGVTREGVWMAAVLTCGEGAVLSHESAAALWGIRPAKRAAIDVSVPAARDPRRRGIRVHRRRAPRERTTHDRIPTTTAAQTVIDIAPRLALDRLERAIDEADKLDLVHPRELHAAAAAERGRGPAIVRDLLDRRTFVLTDSELERRLIPIARRAGLPKPVTRASVNGFMVDFHWPDLRLVVETDGGRYHRTPSQQRRDRVRDHAHAVAGLTSVRFTHDQVAHEPDYVAGILRRLS